MKKILSLILVLIVFSLFVGCSSSDDEKKSVVSENDQDAESSDQKESGTPTPTAEATATAAPIPNALETAVPQKDTSYIIPDSNSRMLSAEEVAAMDANTKQMAINEIYARHGRLFDTPEIQEYFNSKAWYQGSIAAANFDESVFNEFERANINILADNATGGNPSTAPDTSVSCIAFGGTYSQVVSSDPYMYFTFTISLTDDAAANLTAYPIGYIVGSYTLDKTQYSQDNSWSASDYYDEGAIVKTEQNVYSITTTYNSGDEFSFEVLSSDHIINYGGPAPGEFYLGDAQNYSMRMGTR